MGAGRDEFTMGEDDLMAAGGDDDAGSVDMDVDEDLGGDDDLGGRDEGEQ
jgi:hypothetical protein